MTTAKTILLELLQKLFSTNDLDPRQAIELYKSNLNCGNPGFNTAILEQLFSVFFDPSSEELNPDLIPDLIEQINRQHFGES